MDKSAIISDRRISYPEEDTSGRGLDNKRRVANLVRSGVNETIARQIINFLSLPGKYLGSDRDPTSHNPLRRYGSHLLGALVQSALFGGAGYMLAPEIARAIGGKGDDANFDETGPRNMGLAAGLLLGILPNYLEYRKTGRITRPITNIAGKPLTPQEQRVNRTNKIPMYKAKVPGTPHPLFGSSSDWPEDPYTQDTDVAQAWRGMLQ